MPIVHHAPCTNHKKPTHTHITHTSYSSSYSVKNFRREKKQNETKTSKQKNPSEEDGFRMIIYFYSRPFRADRFIRLMALHFMSIDGQSSHVRHFIFDPGRGLGFGLGPWPIFSQRPRYTYRYPSPCGICMF